MTLMGDGGAGGNAGQGSGAAGAAGAGNAGAGAGAGSGTGSGQGSGAQPTWRDSLPEDIRGNATLTKFSDVNSLAKSYIEIQGLVGKKGIFPPGEKATPEQMKEFYKQLGQPEFEKFQINPPEGKKVNQEVADGFRKLAHDAGLLPQQAQGILEWFLGTEEKMLGAQKAAKDNELKTQHADLKKEWGDGFDKQIAAARFAAKELGGEEFLQYLEKNTIGDDVKVLKVLAKAATFMNEDKLRGEGGGKLGQTRQEIQDRIDQIRGDLKGPYFDRAHPAHTQAVREVEGLYQRLHAGQ